MNEKIFIIGYMGSGKTTVGRCLADMMGRPFLDMDETIEKSQKTTIKRLFMTYGEHHFRNLEGKLLDKICKPDSESSSHYEKNVIACGGGIILDEENRNILKEQCCVFLEDDLGAMFDRIKGDTGRPNAYLETEDEEERLSAYKRQYLSRENLYVETASVIINRRGLDPRETAEVIIRSINK